VEGQDSELFVILTGGQHLYGHESFQSVVSGTVSGIHNVQKGVYKAGSTSVDHYEHMEGDTNCSSFSEQKLGSHYEPVGTLLVAQLVEALRYKPEGRGFDCRWSN